MTNVETDVMEDTLKLLGNIGLKLVLLLEIYITLLLLGVKIMNYPLVTIMCKEYYNLVPPQLMLPLVPTNVKLDILNYITLI